MKSEGTMKEMTYERLLMHAKNLLWVIEMTDGYPKTSIHAYTIAKMEIDCETEAKPDASNKEKEIKKSHKTYRL